MDQFEQYLYTLEPTPVVEAIREGYLALFEGGSRYGYDRHIAMCNELAAMDDTSLMSTLRDTVCRGKYAEKYGPYLGSITPSQVREFINTYPYGSTEFQQSGDMLTDILKRYTHNILLKQNYEKNKEQYHQRNKLSYERNRDKRLEYKKKFREENAEQIREYNRKYNEAHRETRNDPEYQHEYYMKNRGRILAARQEYRENNREAVLATQKRYREANREKINAYLREYHRMRRTNSRSEDMSKLDNDALLARYRDTHNVEYFNEWFMRTRNHDADGSRAYRVFMNADRDMANDKRDDAMGDVYTAARLLVENPAFSKLTSDELHGLITRRVNYDLIDEFRDEFGATGKQRGRRNVEIADSDMSNDDAGESFIGNAIGNDSDEHEREVNDILFGVVKDEFSRNGGINGITGDEIFSRLLDAVHTDDDNKSSTPAAIRARGHKANDFKIAGPATASKVGVSRELMSNKIADIRQRLKDKGVIGASK